MSYIFTRLVAYARAHVFVSSIVIILVLGGGYWTYAAARPAASDTRYMLGTVATGTVVATVSGAGQVSPSHEVTLNPKASGTITRVLIANGQTVSAGQPLAYIDATTQENAIASAKSDLTSAQISLEKLQEPADQLSLTQAQNALSQAQTNLAQDYDGGYNDVASTFADLPTVMTGLKNILYGNDRELGGTVVDNADYYTNQISEKDSRAQSFLDDANAKYKTALDAYNETLDLYKATPRTAATSSIASLVNDSYATTKNIADAVQAATNLIELYQQDLNAREITPNAVSDTHISDLNEYTSTLSSHIAALLSSKTGIVNDAESITEKQQSLAQLQSGPDSLDVQSAQLSIQERQNALKQAEDDLANYTIVAPFAGTIADLNLHTGDAVSSGTAIATLITRDYIADLSLNEVDAAKVAAGQKATLTFDAIDGLSLAGVVAYVSPLGAVTQGVVSYDVKIEFTTTDPRIKAGMTVNADIAAAAHQNVLTVPSTAVKSQGGEYYVEAFNPPLSNPEAGGAASDVPPVEIPVTVGISDDTNTEITGGLTAGEQIVVGTRSNSAVPAASASSASRSGAAAGFGGGRGAIRL